jgi:hypothetical protein
MSLLLFCDDPLHPKRADESFSDEVEAAVAAGATLGLVSYEALVRGDADGAVRRVATTPDATRAVYRGWMLTVAQYEAFHRALSARGIALINDPTQYRHTHHFPESAAILDGWTPDSTWIPAAEIALPRIFSALEKFGSQPVIVKDYVKSRKHEWAEACFIPAADDRRAVEQIVGRFLALQGAELQGGLVFRAFVALEPIGPHPQSGMPLTREHRLFYRDGALLAHAPYWAEGDDTGELPPFERLAPVAERVQSRFFSLDVARRRDGEWTIIELGDGQVTGLPDRLPPATFYRALLSHG